MSRGKYAKVRALENEAVGLLVAADRQWWRPWKNRQRRKEARRLLAVAGDELDAIDRRAAEFAEAVRRRKASR